MSEWTKNLGSSMSACHGCTKRKPGCHDVKKCKDWAAEVERRKAEKEAREAQKPVTRKSWQERRKAGQI